jgi:hypothetical protein
MKFKYTIFANLIFIFHVFVVLTILFDWLYPQYRFIYLSTLILTLISEAILGCCILTKWEFDLRKKLEPSLDYDYGFVTYYGYKFFNINIPRKYVKYPAIVFLVVSIIINLWKKS